MLEVKRIPVKIAEDLILNVHYAKRKPSISYCFGLYNSGVLEGICSYGTPPAATVRSGIAGPEHSRDILELNRLVLYNNFKNHASYLISNSLKLLPKPKIVISYADTAYNHLGTVYKASNFLYYGLSAKRTNWSLKGKSGKHGQTIADISRGMKDRAKYMRETYGSDFFLAPRSRKHRYIYVIARSVKEKKMLINKIRYDQQPYPK